MNIFSMSPLAAHIRSLSLDQINAVEAEMRLVKAARAVGVDWDWVRDYVSGTFSLENIPEVHKWAKDADPFGLCI